jgi:hypothetical protein
MRQGPSGVPACVPGDRWLTIMMKRIDPALFSDAFTS